MQIMTAYMKPVVVEAMNRVKEKIQPAVDQLISDFRELIGIE
jgi:hypothetical protein